MSDYLSGTTILLTGASMGIGRALALQLAARGVNLVLVARTEERLKTLTVECEARGVHAQYVAGDAGVSKTMERAVWSAAALGEFAGFIHAAGVLNPGPHTFELPPDDFDAVFRANVTGAHRLMHHAVPQLLERGEGLAVFFGSGAAERAQEGIGAYCAAKSAEEHLGRMLMTECPQIHTLIYRPGIVETRMQVEARESTGGGAQALHTVFRPWKEQGQLLTPEESAAALLRILDAGPGVFAGNTMRAGDV